MKRFWTKYLCNVGVYLRFIDFLLFSPGVWRLHRKGERVDEVELRSGLRKMEVVKLRRMFCQIAVKKMRFSGADVTHFFGINTSAVNRLAVPDELPKVEKCA